MTYTTRKNLLNGCIDGKEDSWKAFQDFYRPLIRICGHDFNLTDEQLKDLQQDVLIDVLRTNLIGKYDRAKGRFRDYLRTVIQRKAIAIIKNDSRQRGLMPPPWLEDEASFETKWNEEWHAFLMEMALEELKSKVSTVSYMIYDLYVNQNTPPAVVAKLLSVTPNQVYIAKTRCVQLLKEIVARLKEDDSL